MSWRWINNNSLVNNYPIVTEPNCYVSTDWGWNTTSHQILACHRGDESGKKKKIINKLLDKVLIGCLPFVWRLLICVCSIIQRATEVYISKINHSTYLSIIL